MAMVSPCRTDSASMQGMLDEPSQSRSTGSKGTATPLVPPTWAPVEPFSNTATSSEAASSDTIWTIPPSACDTLHASRRIISNRRLGSCSADNDREISKNWLSESFITAIV